MTTRDKAWIKDISVLFEESRLLEFYPTKEMSPNEKLNAIMRLSIYSTILLYFFSKNSKYLFIIVLASLFTYMKYKRNIENFESNCGCDDIQKPIRPTADNPFMNINLITDTNKDLDKAPVSYNKPELKKKIDKAFGETLYKDVSDLYGKRNSQRNFYTMPSTTIPNQQTSFAKWLYQTGPTCKEEGIKCAPQWDPLS